MPSSEDERRATRDEIGTYLRDFGDDFRLDGAARVEMGDDVVDVNPLDDVAFEITIEDDPAPDGSEIRRLTFELAWEKSEFDEELRD